MLSTAQLGQMRTTLDRSLPETCTVYRSAEVATSQGAVTRTTAVVLTSACRVAPRARPRDGVVGEQSTPVGDWVVTFPAGSDVRIHDQVGVNGRTFEVIKGAERSYELSRRVECVEMG